MSSYISIIIIKNYINIHGINKWKRWNKLEKIGDLDMCCYKKISKFDYWSENIICISLFLFYFISKEEGRRQWKIVNLFKNSNLTGFLILINMMHEANNQVHKKQLLLLFSYFNFTYQKLSNHVTKY